ncbi:MAG: YitT family protein [Candidatus Faecousia sp.]|nr:YitT family protein [Oscillospiraceae bacterium]MDY2558468.1 YitT family protein [Candidatus Faecousia sp.]
MKQIWNHIRWLVLTAIGSAVFALGFALFLIPNEINTGGISGLAMILRELLGFGSVGILTLLMNIPLFLIGGLKIGRRFFAGSLVGMVVSSVLMDVFSVLSFQTPDPLLGGLYGGVICGTGLGLVFLAGASTGGSDIVVRLVKKKYRNLPIGRISIMFDAMVVLLTGVVFRDISKALYSGVVVFVCGQVIDAMVYRFDYSRVALIVSREHEAIARAIGEKLDRGATYLHGAGSYSGQNMEIVLTVVRKGQLAELKELVMDIDKSAFVIVQEAHQVLGDGFSHYSPDAL